MGTFYETHEQKFQTWTFSEKNANKIWKGTFTETHEQKLKKRTFFLICEQILQSCEIVKKHKKEKKTKKEKRNKIWRWEHFFKFE